MSKARDLLLGKRRRVDLAAKILKLTGPSSRPYYLPPPMFSASGLHVWILRPPDFETLGPRLLQTSGLPSGRSFIPGIITAHGVVASVFSGNTVPVQGGAHADVRLTS
jgi:hypothetical protein